ELLAGLAVYVFFYHAADRFMHPPALGVVGVAGGGAAVHRNQPVLGVVSVGVSAVVEQVPVGIVGVAVHAVVAAVERGPSRPAVAVAVEGIARAVGIAGRGQLVEVAHFAYGIGSGIELQSGVRKRPRRRDY